MYNGRYGEAVLTDRESDTSSSYNTGKNELSLSTAVNGRTLQRTWIGAEVSAILVPVDLPLQQRAWRLILCLRWD